MDKLSEEPIDVVSGFSRAESLLGPERQVIALLIGVIEVGKAWYFDQRDLDNWIASHKERRA